MKFSTLSKTTILGVPLNRAPDHRDGVVVERRSVKQKQNTVVLHAGAIAVLAIALLGNDAQHVVTSESATAPLVAEVRLLSTPAHVGTEEITVVIRDGSGFLTRGASVIIEPSYATQRGGHAMAMPKMGAVAKTIRAVDANDGTYQAQLHLTAVAHWTVVVHVIAAHTQTTITRSFEVR